MELSGENLISKFKLEDKSFLKYSEEGVNHELQHLLKSKKETVQIVSKKIGKHYNTVNRILKNQNKRIPDKDTILKILQYSFEESSLLEIDKRIKEKGLVHLNDFFNAAFGEKSQLDHLFEVKDQIDFFILSNSCTKNGATISEIVSTILKIETEIFKDKFGPESSPDSDLLLNMGDSIRKKVKARIKELIKNNVILEREGVFQAIKENIFWSEETSRKYSASLLRLWESADKYNDSTMMYLTDSVSEDTFYGIIELQRKFHKELREIIKSDKKVGRRKISILNFAGNMNPKDYVINEKKEVLQ